MNLIFADSFYFFALINPNDQSHNAAIQYSSLPIGPIITTAWILTELADGLSRVSDRKLFIHILHALESDPKSIIIEPTQFWFDAGLKLYKDRVDKNWSLTDCISFEVMRQYNVNEALTGDRHFVQAGFKALLNPEKV